MKFLLASSIVLEAPHYVVTASICKKEKNWNGYELPQTLKKLFELRFKWNLLMLEIKN